MRVHSMTCSLGEAFSSIRSNLQILATMRLKSKRKKARLVNGVQTMPVLWEDLRMKMSKKRHKLKRRPLNRKTKAMMPNKKLTTH